MRLLMLGLPLALLASSLAGCVAVPTEHPGAWAVDLEAHVSLWQNWMWGSTSHNMSAHIELEYLNGTKPPEHVVVKTIRIRSNEGLWEAEPKPGNEPGEWVARGGPEWPIGTLAQGSILAMSGTIGIAIGTPNLTVRAAY